MLALYLFFSYLAGSFMTAKIIANLKGINIKQHGSGNVGARNAGRILGKSAFLWTVLGDGGKMLIVILIGCYLDFSITIIALATVFCVIGHLHPFWLNFKGGLGVATCISAMIFLTPTIALFFIAAAGLMLVFTKSFTLSMAVGFIVYSLAIILLLPAAWPMIITVSLVLAYHLPSIFERINKKKPSN